MKNIEQYLKDEHEQAVKRKGIAYADAYIEGLKDGLSQSQIDSKKEENINQNGSTNNK